MNNLVKNADKVLDYWITMENLQQDEFPAETKRSGMPKRKQKRFLYRKSIQWDDDLFAFFDDLNQSYSFSAHGNPTFFIGKPDLEPCLYELASCLNQDYQPAERNRGKIAIFAMTLSSDFKSIEAFSFSPILREICHKKGINLDDESTMKSDLQGILDEYLEKICDPFLRHTEYEVDIALRKLSLSIFQEYFLKIIDSVLDPWYEKRNGTPQGKNSVILIECILFDTEITMNATEEPPPPGLSNNFFSEDLYFLRSWIQHNKDFPNTPMGADILNYILSFAPDMDFSSRRIDLVPDSPEDAAAGSPLYEEMNSVLSPSMAPLGKWPGRYMPALMQEVAINAYTARFLGKTGRIFSVNGPPGTGKTTLLKEIVADHIVERANLLAKIENPDDLFQLLPFNQPGGYDDYTKKFAAFKPQYDYIHNYSVLIASSNNKAVENISKELPQTKSVLDSFEGLEKINTTDSEDSKYLHPDVVKGFTETRELFSQNSAEDSIPCLVRVPSEDKEEAKRKILKDFPDIYFSRYADQLLDGEEGEAWGLVSCALGKKDNINQFSSVLWDLIMETFSTKEKLYDIHAVRYQAARNQFVDQYKKTERLRRDLEDICRKNKKKYEKLDNLVSKARSVESSIHSEESSLQDMEIQLGKNKSVYESLESQLDSVKESKSKKAPLAKAAIERHLAEKKQAMDSLLEDLKSIKAEISGCNLSLEQEDISIRSIDCDLEKSQQTKKSLKDSMPNSFFCFFSSEKKALRESNLRKISELDKSDILLKQQRVDHEQECLNIKQKLLVLTDKISRQDELINRQQSNISSIEDAMASESRWGYIDGLQGNEDITEYIKTKEQETKVMESLRVSREKTGQLEEKIEKTRRSVSELKQLLDDLIRQKADLQKEFESESPLRNEKGPDYYTAMTLSFFNKLASKDFEVSTWAQLQNPWITEEFNREREKLFRLALKVHREFILSSKQCRNNLNLLLNVWSGKIRLIDEDRDFVIPELFRTLWLLVPVISTTFASVGRFFQNARMPGLFGTLVVDEAGQASPQMAAGALFRARRAIIVGDPKQVEPVVTDALEIIRRSYKNPFLNLYLSKTLSVQQFADKLNPLGTELEGINGEPEWVGCPLIVHRRCIDPMYSISNFLSYGGIMKLQTLPPSQKKIDTFIHTESTWFDIKGKEEGEKGNHFVRAQGAFVLKLLEVAFQKSDFPSLYIISPFKTVSEGIKEYVKENASEDLKSHSEFLRWVDGDASSAQIGTVHTFQGKEANEVIFLLGCDKNAKQAFTFVNANIVNVAATRAKYRLYVVGDKDIWLQCRPVSTMLDFLKVTIVEHDDEPEENLSAEEQANKDNRVILRNEDIKTYFRHALGLVPNKPGAVEELDIISPWISQKIIEDTDPVNGYDFKASFKRLLDNNVTIKIIYGIKFHGNKEQQERFQKTEACANKLLEWFGAYPNFKIIKGNTHRKIFICDNRFYVISSMNILSNKGDFWKTDAWSEGGEASGDQSLIEAYRQKDFSF